MQISLSEASAERRIREFWGWALRDLAEKPALMRYEPARASPAASHSAWFLWSILHVAASSCVSVISPVHCPDSLPSQGLPAGPTVHFAVMPA